jgi:hypothetical protein
MLSLKTLLAATAASGALAVPAVASAAERPSLPDPIPVPAGQVQHTVTDATFKGNYTIRGVVPWHHITESWVSAHRARAVTRDANGKLLGECVVVNERTRCYSAADNEITTFTSSRPDPGWASWQYRGALIKAQIDVGWYAIAGDTTALGRPAKALRDTHGDSSSTTSIVADAATLAPLVRTTTGSSHGKTFTQTESVTRFETISARQAHFKMLRHPGAKVRRGR